LFLEESHQTSVVGILSMFLSSILSLTLIIGTLVKSDWSLMYRLPMSIALLGSLVGAIVGIIFNMNEYGENAKKK
jgi:hypothetical protein